MISDGICGQAELFCDFSIGFPLFDQFEDLHFTLGELVSVHYLFDLRIVFHFTVEVQALDQGVGEQKVEQIEEEGHQNSEGTAGEIEKKRNFGHETDGQQCECVKT